MKILSILTALCFAVTSHAQIEFAPLIEQSITQQDDLAAQIKYGTKTAENTANADEDSELSAKDNVKTFKTSEATVSDATRAPASAPKEFSVKLHPTAKVEAPATGRESAARYFPYVPKPKRTAHYKKSKSGKVIKTAKAKKPKNGRSTASVGKKKAKKAKKAT